jgi:N-methylhydantoinase A
MTDAALLIGILAPDRFLGGKMPLYEDRSLVAFEELDTSLTLSHRVAHAWMVGLHNVADGLVDLTIRRGIDLREFSLVAFGAAGPMLVPGLLDILPLESVIVPPNPGGFSALGLMSSDQVFSESRTLYAVLDPELAPRISELLQTMERELLDSVQARTEDVQVVRTFDGRLLGQGFETPFIPIPPGELGPKAIEDMIVSFHAEYERRNGHRFEAFPVEGVTYRVQVVVPSSKVQYSELGPRSGGSECRPTEVATLRHLYESEVEAGVYERGDLARADVIAGPAIIREDTSTTFIPVDRRATVGRYGEIVIV